MSQKNNILDLKKVEVRPIRKDKVAQWTDYMGKYHYLGFQWMGGRSLRYIAHINGNWVALLGWSSASKNCGVRERYIGWSGEKKYRRLKYIINNSRYLVLPWIDQKNLASRVLALNLKRISADYEKVYGHPVYFAETFVDESRFKGSCYKASNWKHVGYTEGYSRSNRTYNHHGQVKAVYLYSLCKNAADILSGELLPYDMSLLKDERRWSLMKKIPLEELIVKIGEFKDPRGTQGKRHSLEIVIALAVCAVIYGCKSFRAIGDWAQSLCMTELKRLGSSRNSPPSETTIRRTLQRIDAAAFDKFISQWIIDKKILQDSLETMDEIEKKSGNLKGYGIAIDGKTLRGSHVVGKKTVHLLSAVLHKEGIVIAQEDVGEKTNEITHAKPLLDDINIEGAVVTADAMHTQTDFARFIVEKKKADYVFTAKDNQPTLLSDLKSLDLKKTPNLNRITKKSIKCMAE